VKRPKQTPIGYIAVYAYDPPARRELDPTAYPGAGIYELPNGLIVVVGTNTARVIVGLKKMMRAAK
jgi:hypothetical protein